MGGSEVMRLQAVYKNYGRITALRGVSLRVERGDRIVIVGPNGSGKTTLIKTALGLARPTRGSVTLFSRNPPGASPQREILEDRLCPRA